MSEKSCENHYLVKIILSNHSSIVLDRKRGGLPRDFLLSIPYFELRLLNSPAVKIFGAYSRFLA